MLEKVKLRSGLLYCIALILSFANCGSEKSSEKSKATRLIESQPSSLKIHDLRQSLPYKLSEFSYQLEIEGGSKGTYRHTLAVGGTLDSNKDTVSLRRDQDGVYITHYKFQLPLSLSVGNSNANLSILNSVAYTLSIDSSTSYYLWSTNSFDTNAYALMSVFDQQYQIEDLGKVYFEYALDQYHTKNVSLLGWISKSNNQLVFTMIALAKNGSSETLTLTYVH